MVASALFARDHKVLSDGTISRAPDCMAAIGCDNYVVANITLGETRLAAPDQAWADRRRYIFQLAQSTRAIFASREEIKVPVS